MKSFLIFFLFISLSALSQTDSLRHRIHQIIQNKNAKVGLAIRGLENGDTLSINGATSFPLFSVVKIPTALTVLHLVDMKKLSLDSSIHFVHSFLDTNTFSPIRDEINKVEFDFKVEPNEKLF